MKNLTWGQKKKTRNAVFSVSRKGNKKIDCQGFNSWLEKKGKTCCFVSYES